MRPILPLLAALGLAFLPAACSRLPGGAPASEEVLRETKGEAADFAVYPVTRAFLPTVTQWPAPSQEPRLPWLGASQGPKTQVLQPGDRVSIAVWDSNDNSLLTAPEQKVVQLQDMVVSVNGDIFMPYVGSVSIGGLTPDLAREKLQVALENIVPSAQVQFNMTEGRNNSVDLVSGVIRPGSYPMPDRNYSVMGLIAAGGGISAGMNNPQIRLVRGRNIYGTSVQQLLDKPSLDTRLHGGDRIFVEEDERYFLSFGATGREDLHIFTKDEVSAMDAMAISGGLQDSKADPKGLLVLREYPAAAVAPGVRGPRRTRVVFTLDLSSADGLFSARQFKIQPGDLVMATESPINDALTVSNIVGNFFGVFSRIGG
ncbi:polysaccharide biosynthesis/export family protein [Pelagibacterium sp.]|uniref:polysaccharide biosynthesis/export family protein n=1 Tax=Pelagibacterium sp. TaxID=1967288 RepID=UPI003A8FD46D